MRALLAAALLCWLASEARAAPATVVVEIDAAAERVVDARSARRLIPLELSDVAVPSLGAGRGPELFFRVLGRDAGSLRLELWERGEFHGSRALSVTGENPQLLARRVALAAAELGRRLARKRQAAQLRDARLKLAREAREREARARTQDGPFALRSELSFGSVPGRLWLFGSRASAELTMRGALRLDVAGDAWAGRLKSARWSELYGVGLGPAYRLTLTPWLDADAGVRVAAFVVQVPGALALDRVPGQRGSWTAMATAATRLELRITRQARALLGVEAGGLLRSVTYLTDSGDERLRGAWWSGSLGLVLTPP